MVCSKNKNLELPDKNIVLAGILCAGKTSVARRIAKITGRPHYDSDQILVDRSGVSPSELINSMSRYEFQCDENDVITYLAGLSQAVISIGSGTIGHENAGLREDNIAKLKSGGILINLEASLDELYRRYLLDKHNEDLRRYAEDMRRRIGERIDERAGIHRAVCDITIDTTGLSIDQVAYAILGRIGGKQCQN